MNYHLVLTRRCNLNCSYCRGGEEDGPNSDIQYSLDDLKRFLQTDRNLQIMFYGGEPTLRIPLMLDIMGRFDGARFMLQTNALLLNKIPFDHVKKFHSILVSIDGPRGTTDGYRSAGVYDRVVGNVRWLRSNGFEGDIIARMAISEQSDVYRDVRHLLDLTDPSFDHVHWQLNVVWDAEDNWTDFDGWIRTVYKPGIERLAREWVERMEFGIVEGIVPFLPIMHGLLTGESSGLRCGSGIDTFAIHVDGRIGVCPISPDWDFSIVGDIWESSPADLKDTMSVDEPCPSCGEFELCGGRCLFANKERLWGEEGFKKVCGTVEHLIGRLRSKVPKVQSFIDDGRISLQDFSYPEFNNGCEIVP
ncbi:MAG: TIGR04084 family radical SAM/SPASM domain-containing protein [Candidatus Thorarchaeota archaeon]|nr:MAG: TIGR04084 family radical SAM/SPASM domain-containing protein [Candidatus Thorarchaeota archaeon]